MFKLNSQNTTKNVFKSLLVVMAMATGSAHAVPITSSGIGLASANVSIDFSEVALASNTTLTNQYNSFGVSFIGVTYNGCNTCAVASPGGVKPDIGNFSFNNTGAFNDITISFDSLVSGAAFNFASNFSGFTFSAYNGASLVEQNVVNINTTSVNGTSGWGFYGFDGIVFDSIVINAGAALLIDNLEFATIASVPEPSVMWLLGSGLVLVGFTRRKV